MQRNTDQLNRDQLHSILNRKYAIKTTMSRDLSVDEVRTLHDELESESILAGVICKIVNERNEAIQEAQRLRGLMYGINGAEAKQFQSRKRISEIEREKKSQEESFLKTLANIEAIAIATDFDRSEVLNTFKDAKNFLGGLIKKRSRR